MNTATFSLATMAPAIPEIVLLALTATILLVDLFIDDENRAATYWLTIASLLGTAFLCMGTFGHASTVTFQRMFVSDLLAQMLKVLTLLTVAATLVLRRTYPEVRALLMGEFMVLALTGTLGMMVMISAQ